MTQKFKTKRTFVVYQWNGNIWLPWFHYNGSKWRLFDPTKSFKGDKSGIMPPMHIFFETETEFHEWIGEDRSAQLFSDCL